MTLAEHNGRLLAMWVDPMRPRDLVVRTLEYGRRNAQWSEPSISQIPESEQVPAASRLFAVTVGQTIYVFWTVPTASSVALHGGWLKTVPEGGCGAISTGGDDQAYGAG